MKPRRKNIFEPLSFNHKISQFRLISDSLKEVTDQLILTEFNDGDAVELFGPDEDDFQ